MNVRTVAFYGAGMLGAGFVTSMQRQGIAVRVWNRTHERAKALESTGAHAFDDAADAARGADLVHICVRDESAVDEILQRALSGIAKGTIVVDHTTVAVDSVAPRAKRLADAGLRFLHAPVFMGPPQAHAAKGTMLASGEEDTFAQVRDHLAKLTERLEYFGSDLTTAATYKLMGNAMILAVIGGLSDVFAIAQRNGIDRERAYKLFSFYDVSGQISGRGARMAHDDYEPTWTLDMARKDARLMQRAADRELPIVDAVERALDQADARGFGGLDLGALAKTP